MENVLLLEIKQLYDSLVAAPYGEYVHGYGTQKPNGFKYKSNAQTLFNKVVELNVVRLILMNKRYFSYRILWKKK